nr:E3 ubiquitin-protein ligase siah-1-like [Aegilops tauschii subsp. strangulata]
MPMHRIQYGKVIQLQVPVSEPRCLLFAEEDDHAFFVAGGMLDVGAPIAVSVVCIREGASPPPHYTIKVWANGPPGEPKGRTDVVKVEIEVTRSKEPVAVAVQELTFYTCKGGHMACADCCGERLGNQRQCQKCERGGGFNMRNTTMDVVLSSVRVRCLHEGCGLYITYHKLTNHQSVCPLAPRKCPCRLRL